MNYQSFSFLYGFSVWLVGTLAFRFFGHLFFHIEDPLVEISLFIAVTPLLYLLMNWVFTRFRLSNPQRLKSAVLMAVPGMFCDVLCLKYHDVVFPSFTIEQAMVLSAWLLWVYAIVLFIGLSTKERSPAT